METQHGNWLRQLAADRKGGVPLPAITRGEAYKLTMDFPIDLSGSTFTGSIAIAPDAPSSIGAFTVTKGSWDGVKFPVSFTLTQAQVNNDLPSDENADGLAEVVFSIAQDGERIFAGVIPISGKV